MSYRKLFVGLVMIGAFLVCSSPLFGAAVVRPSGQSGEKNQKDAQPTIRINKHTELMEKMENGVLYTERNRYNLSGVKIIDLAKNKRIEEPVKGKKRMVELTFADKVLKRVVIYR